MIKLSIDGEAALKRAFGDAHARHHRQVAPEHLLAALTHDQPVAALLEACSAGPERLARELRRLFDALPTARGAPDGSIELWRTVELALAVAEASAREQLEPVDLFIALLRQPQLPATALLTSLGVRRLTVLRLLAHPATQPQPTPPTGADDSLVSVVIHDDDFTPMEFVEQLLCEVFLKSAADATDVMLDAHRSGCAVVGIYPLALARDFVAEALRKAAVEEHPLRFSFAAPPAAPAGPGEPPR